MNLAGIHAHGPNAAVRRRNIKTTNEVRALIANASGNMSVAQISRTFQVPKLTADRIIARYNETGSSNKNKQGGYKPKK